MSIYGLLSSPGYHYDCLSAVKLPPAHPSRVETYVPRHGRKMEYAGHTTKPQQDHRSVSNSISIEQPIDNRATPWNDVLRANMHNRTPTALPPKNASCMEVREWIYFVLTNSKWSWIPDRNPQEINRVINHWIGNGTDLRDMQKKARGSICPSTWTSVYHDVYAIKQSHRDLIEKYLTEVVSRLHAKECRNEARLRKMEEKEDEKWDLMSLGQKTEKQQYKTPGFWRKLLCHGKKEIDNFDAVSVDTLPAYVEKVYTSGR